MPVRSAARVPTRLAAYLVENGVGEAGAPAVDVAADLANSDVDTLVGSGLARLGLLSDLSTGGALVQTSHPAPPVGRKVRLSFQLRTASLDAEVIVDGWVRSAPSASEDDEFPAFGVAFDALGERELTPAPVLYLRATADQHAPAGLTPDWRSIGDRSAIHRQSP